jgi:RNA polymerase sigma factor (sigma-70 family)
MVETPDTPPSRFADEIATAYRAHYALMEFVVARKFGVPEDDVADVIHEVVLAYMRARGRVEDERAWLVGAACNASRVYWRKRAGGAAPSSSGDQAVEAACDPVDVARRLDLSAALRRIPRRCRRVLHLRFYEEYSSEQLAAYFDTTIDYARKMVHRCVGAARVLLADLRSGR